MVGCPVVVCHECVDHCMGELPHVVVLNGVLCDSVGKCDAEVGAFSVADNGGGVRAVSVGGENVGRWQDVLESGGDDADGVCVSSASGTK